MAGFGQEPGPFLISPWHWRPASSAVNHFMYCPLHPISYRLYLIKAYLRLGGASGNHRDSSMLRSDFAPPKAVTSIAIGPIQAWLYGRQVSLCHGQTEGYSCRGLHIGSSIHWYGT